MVWNLVNIGQDNTLLHDGTLVVLGYQYWLTISKIPRTLVSIENVGINIIEMYLKDLICKLEISFPRINWWKHCHSFRNLLTEEQDCLSIRNLLTWKQGHDTIRNMLAAKIWLSCFKKSVDKKTRLDKEIFSHKTRLLPSRICWPLAFMEFNSLAPGRFKRNLRKVIFKLILMIGGWGIFCKIALKWMSMDLTDDKSTLVQVMAWCRQATSHYLSQCWPRFMSPNGVTRPQ